MTLPRDLLPHSAVALQELSQWRQQQLQESLRNSVLDEEAAAKFSTAAALAAKEKRAQMAKANYDKGLLTAVDTEEKAREVSWLLRPEWCVMSGWLLQACLHAQVTCLQKWSSQRVVCRLLGHAAMLSLHARRLIRSGRLLRMLCCPVGQASCA